MRRSLTLKWSDTNGRLKQLTVYFYKSQGYEVTKIQIKSLKSSLVALFRAIEDRPFSKKSINRIFHEKSDEKMNIFYEI